MSSVKVAVRVRPFNKREIGLQSRRVISMTGDTTSKSAYVLMEYAFVLLFDILKPLDSGGRGVGIVHPRAPIERLFGAPPK